MLHFFDEVGVLVGGVLHICDVEKDVGIDTLMQRIVEVLPECPPFFDKDQLTDKPERFFVNEIIREKILLYLQDEVPHGTAVSILSMKFREDRPLCDINADIICERESHKGILIGKGGAMLKKIGMAARTDIEEMLGCKVNLKLFVKVRKDWKDNENMMKSLGYNVKDL